MMKKNLFKLVPILGFLAVLLSIGGCSSPSGPQGSPPDTSALEATITVAEEVKEETISAANGSTVSPIDYWVSPTLWNALDSAITEAIAVRDDPLDQAAVDTMNTTLQTAMNAITSARAYGTKTSGWTLNDLAGLKGKADTLIAGLSKNDSNPDEISPNKEYLTTAHYTELEAAITAAADAGEATTEEALDALYNTLAEKMKNVKKGTPTTESKAALKSVMTTTQTETKDIKTAADASYAPVGSAWATPAQWKAFNTAKDNAQVVYDNADATKKAVEESKTAFDSAYTAFKAAVKANPPATGTNLVASLTITGMADYKGEQFGVSIVVEDKANLSQDDVIARSKSLVTVGTDGTLKVDPLLNLADKPWQGDGSYFIVVEEMEFGHWISKEKHNFLTTSNAVLTWSPEPSSSDMRRLGFENTFLGLARIEVPTYPGFPEVTLDEFFAEMADLANEDSFDNYASWKVMMLDRMNVESQYIDIVSLYKDKYLETEFKGSDRVNPTTKLYCMVPWWSGAESGPPEYLGNQEGSIQGDITLHNVPDGGVELWVYAQGQGNSWHTEWSPSFKISDDHPTTTEHLELPIFEAYHFNPGETTFNINIYPNAIATQNGSMRFSGYSKDVPNANANVGSLGTIDCSYIELSGTIEADYYGTPDKVYVYARNNKVNTGTVHIEGGSQIEPLHDGWDWKLALPKAALPDASNSITITVSLEKDGHPTYNSPASIKTITVPGNSSHITGIDLGMVTGE